MWENFPTIQLHNFIKKDHNNNKVKWAPSSLCLMWPNEVLLHLYRRIFRYNAHIISLCLRVCWLIGLRNDYVTAQSVILLILKKNLIPISFHLIILFVPCLELNMWPFPSQIFTHLSHQTSFASAWRLFGAYVLWFVVF